MLQIRRTILACLLAAMLATNLPLTLYAAPTSQATPQNNEVLTAELSDGASGELVSAAGVLPSTLYDPDEIGWASIRGLSSADFADHFNQMKDDYLMLDIEVDEIDGQQRVSAIWQRNTDNRGWAEHRNLTSDEFHTKWVAYKDQGYRLIDQESYTLNGNRYYAGIWVQNKENLAWASYRDLTSDEFSQKFQEYKDAGYLMVDVEGYPTGAGLRYAMIWVKNSEKLDWVEYRNLSSEEFGQKFDELKDKYRVWDIESYRYNGVQYYAAIWVENKNGRGWVEYRDMTATDYRNRWYRLRDLGYRLVDFEIYPTANGERYAGVWRQNSDRPDWALKDQIDNLIKTHLDTFDVPGIGVAIAKDGEIKYMRGFGYQDVNDGVWYSARTLNRLASVSKAVASVLTLRLWQDHEINDLDATSKSLLPALPNHHTHTVRQLLANRSGIGHYEDYSFPAVQYNTALAAAQAFWNTDSDPNQPGTQLVYTPGTDCKYSTHASTVLGAVLEGVLNKPISTIVENELSAPFDLPTLQVENRSDGDDNRSALYDASNNEASADNISWKVLGGGLEVSPYDMVRFGMKVLDGTIIDSAALTEMQLAPAPVPCTDPDWGNMSNYALGWSVGTQNGTPVMWKGGNQLGANTSIRLYPDKDMVIVVLANRNENHNTGTLASQIGALILDNEPAGAPAAPYHFGGVAHIIAGNLQAFFNQAQQLVLTNIGRGGDSIKSVLENVTFWQSDLQLYFDRTARVPMQNIFTVYGAEGQAASTLTIGATEKGLQATASFGAANYQIQYLLDDTILQSVESNNRGGQPAMINWDKIWCTLNLPSGAPSQICDVLVSFYQNQGGACEWNIRLAQPIQLTDTEGKPMRINRVRLVEIEEEAARQGTQIQEPMTFTGLAISPANLELLTVESEQSGGPEMVPAMPTAPLTEQIFLPLVTR
ncbi:MAG: serine hydrolase [Caldilineaceae bacterium]